MDKPDGRIRLKGPWNSRNAGGFQPPYLLVDGAGDEAEGNVLAVFRRIIFFVSDQLDPGLAFPQKHNLGAGRRKCCLVSQDIQW
ncbi:hypothetical protein SDC9_13327 [bioreactor metagenome]|uniref:Uncharacterized protein n=1 Tax=bioreactor metagenome TaxID=1076179 RepID=A0A644TLT4_9ZZZZ